MRIYAIGLELECEVSPPYPDTRYEPGSDAVCQFWEPKDIDDPDEFRAEMASEFTDLDARFALACFARTHKFPTYTVRQVERWDSLIARRAERQFYDNYR